ncbi:MAG: succinate dehydrogenase [Rhabdochlamydiaceae bacterium]|jgi:succinate dehydrogenase / fumarate reductase cytochrome b subunit
MGLWLVLFLMEHLFVNSQAALLLGESGRGFVESVNAIHNLPYLPVIECVLLGVPILIHMVWGVRLLFTAKSNSVSSDGSKPQLSEYKRNKAYSWQRITSWILLFGLMGHIFMFRFLNYPWSASEGSTSSYFVKIKMDKGLYTLADRLGFTLYDKNSILIEKQELANRQEEAAKATPETHVFDPAEQVVSVAAQKYRQKIAWVQALDKKPLQEGEVIAVASNFGTASLLTVRDTFKVPLYACLYTIFVLAACFHGFNGLWTFLITWGFVIKVASQKRAAFVAVGLMLMVTFLGLASIWGTYWLNLRS